MNQYWHAFGGVTAFPWQASKDEQIAVARRMLAANGPSGGWPVCGPRAGLQRGM